MHKACESADEQRERKGEYIWRTYQQDMEVQNPRSYSKGPFTLSVQRAEHEPRVVDFSS